MVVTLGVPLTRTVALLLEPAAETTIFACSVPATALLGETAVIVGICVGAENPAQPMIVAAVKSTEKIEKILYLSSLTFTDDPAIPFGNAKIREKFFVPHLCDVVPEHGNYSLRGLWKSAGEKDSIGTGAQVWSLKHKC
jgi:hypothetical protein